MKDFIIYLKQYLSRQSFSKVIYIAVFTGLLIFCNYSFGIERRIRGLHPWYLSLISYFFFYSFAYFFAWAVVGAREIKAHASRRHFLILLLCAPLYFACKMIHWDFPLRLFYPWNEYALIVLQLPAKLLLLCLMLWFCSRLLREDGIPPPALFGLTSKGFKPAPYFLLLVCLLPLIALASSRPDFLHIYPKVKNVAFIRGYASPVWPWQFLYELSYGLDFLSIELFFRGLLVIGLVRYAGEKAILPMAAFYCTIHFGKPLGECISSFFGGMILGVIALRTRSILGGLIVHLGLAWLMELGGWIGNLFHP
jgi:hypothetical protein